MLDERETMVADPWQDTNSRPPPPPPPLPPPPPSPASYFFLRVKGQQLLRETPNAPTQTL
ncbi:hypothetical protein E2C01_044026 [Portunus trituberculatus]|uniref:Uncharacterized protein n=1 Tax=Portunus trituberculatus TaxID=210409 RepID=A0A5B7FYU7_PORTR|nr:hypothetical protein [Portunus trituberculatus]